MSSQNKIPISKYIKILTDNGVPLKNAMAITGKIYKDFGTLDKLPLLTEPALKLAGVDSQEDRKYVIAALRKAGYGPKRAALKKKTTEGDDSEDSKRTLSGADQQPVAGSSTPLSAVQAAITPPKKKRKRTEIVNEYLPDGPLDDAASYGSLEFNEVLDEQILTTKSTIVNRAPLMTAWATIVAERIGFKREEALSIATVYTELNAVTKGVYLGIYDESKKKGLEATRSGYQPYVDLMGRRPLYQTQNSEWRALSNGVPAKPSVAFNYISRAFRQTTPYILGALRLLAESYSPKELGEKAWGMYAEFRPSADGWGQKSDVKCETILALRKKAPQGPTPPKAKVEEVEVSLGGASGEEVKEPVIKFEPTEVDSEAQEPDAKRAKGMSWEEFEAGLDDDRTFDGIDFDF